MKIRPTSITVVAWLLIVLGGISLVATTVMIGNPTVLELMAKSPIPIPVQYAMNYATLAIMLVSGIAMLKGRNWGRLLYVIATAIGFLIGLVTSPSPALIPGLVFFIVVCFFLFRRNANRYFSATESTGDAQGA